MKLIGKTAIAALIAGSLALGARAADIEIDTGTALVIDGTTTNAATLFVGRYDPDNSLTITNGGTVSAENGYLGRNSENNNLTVTGTNSSLQLSESLSIGENGTENSLIVENGGWVSIGGTNGTANAISIGNTNGTAKLSMKNGASALADYLYVGTSSNEFGSATLTGADTDLTINDSAYIGLEGTNNTVSVSGGATLTVSNLLQVGSTTSSNNTLTIGNKGEVVIINQVEVQNPDSNSIDINSGGKLTYTGDANLNDAAENGFNFASGSSLEIGGSLQFDQMDSGLTIILNDSLNTNLTSTWNTGADEMYVGNTTGNNTLTVQNGASAVAGGSTAHIGESSNNNTINVTGSNSTLTVNGRLFVGMQGDNNTLNIEDGSMATIGTDLRVGRLSGSDRNDVSISGTNAFLTVTNNVLIGERGDQNTLTLSDAGLSIGGDLLIGLLGSENSATFSGSNAVANVDGNLQVGNDGAGENEVTVEDGATLSILGDALLGTNSADNVILVSGTNAYMSIAGSLTMGNLSETNDYTGNKLSIFETAYADIGGDLSIGNGSILQIEAGSWLTVGGDYQQDETSLLEVSVSTNSLGTTNLMVTGEARFSTNSTIKVYDDGTGSDEFEQVILASSGLYIGNTNATTELLNDTNTFNFVNHLLDIDGIVTNNAIVVTTVRLSIAEKSGLIGTPLEPLADEIDDMAFSGNTNAIAMRNILGTELTTDAQRNAAMEGYYGEQQSSIPAHNAINMGIQSVADQLTKRADNTRVRMGLASAGTPSGAAGPHMDDQELQGWVTGFGTWADKSNTDGFVGYDVSMSGFMIGADLSVTPGILFGVAGGSGTSTIDKDNNGSAETDTFFVSAYGSAGTRDWFADASLIYGGNSISANLGSVFDTTADYDAHNFAVYLGGGKEIIGNYLVLTPQASMLFNYYSQESYTEKSTTAVAREVDSFDTLYAQSSIGCSAAFYATMGEVSIKPEFRAYWLHEFNAREEDVDFTLVGSTGSYTLAMQAPESDIIKLGTGVSAKMGEFLELRADLDTRFASDYSDYTLLGSVRYQF